MARIECPASLVLHTPACDDRTPADDDVPDVSTLDAFEAVYTPCGDGARYSVETSQLLHEGSTRVYRGTLTVDGRRPTHSEVVCKLGRRQALHREADLYRGKLAPLQGRYVPTFVGLFDGATAAEAEAGDDGMSCLVLTYEGDRMQESLYTSGIDFRKKVVSALLAVHEAGVCHGAFNEANIVVRDGDIAPLLVGFGGARDHECHRGTPIEFYAPQPHNEAVGCEEVYWACIVAAVWLPATVEFLNSAVPIEWALGGFDALVARAPKGTDPDLARMHAELTREDLLEWIEERELYDGQPLPVKIMD